MCFGNVQAPEPIEIEKPVFVRNPFLDDEDTKARSADALRRGRSSLVIPTGTGIGFEGAGGFAQAGAGGVGGAGGPNTIGGKYGMPGGSSARPDTGPGEMGGKDFYPGKK
ncbi:hypothetical protein LCGC14_3130450 [marine sediment metagenome]|uniref:Uncharacterized protein n=1 Tax=marine sediment metagenome TaxID=412755 RepID=A0A0F8Y6X6_9ZZZZ